MLNQFARKLAYYEYMRYEAVVAHDKKLVEYWEIKYHGFCNAVEIATGFWPVAICYGKNVEIHIGDYQAIIAIEGGCIA